MVNGIGGPWPYSISRLRFDDVQNKLWTRGLELPAVNHRSEERLEEAGNKLVPVRSSAV